MKKKTSRRIREASKGQRNKRKAFLTRLGLPGLVLMAVLMIAAVAGLYMLSPEGAMAAGSGAVLFGATLSERKNRSYETGWINEFPVIASDIIYEGAVAGDNASGYARPLVAGDPFLGFADKSADNSSGSAGDINVRVIAKGLTYIALTGAVITDVGKSVYASDDDTFTFVGTSNTYVGTIYRWVSSGIVVLEFDTSVIDPLAGATMETISANKTLDAEDTGKVFFVDTDAVTITLPATVVGLGPITFVNGGLAGAVAINISPNANDKIMGPDLAGVDDKDLINTKTTAQPGDKVTIVGDGALGWWASALVGTWAAEA